MKPENFWFRKDSGYINCGRNFFITRKTWDSKKLPLRKNKLLNRL
jgi:hypothetical protein